MKERRFAKNGRGLFAIVAVGLVVGGCQSSGSAHYIPKDGAPALPPRGGGCHVDTHLAGAPLALPQPHQIVGEIEAKRSKDQMREGGGDASIAAIVEAACAAGVYAVIDIKAFPGGPMEGGTTYIGKAAVYVDENGRLLGAPKVEEPVPAEAASTSTDAGPTS